MASPLGLLLSRDQALLSWTWISSSLPRHILQALCHCWASQAKNSRLRQLLQVGFHHSRLRCQHSGQPQWFRRSWRSAQKRWRPRQGCLLSLQFPDRAPPHPLRLCSCLAAGRYFQLVERPRACPHLLQHCLSQALRLLSVLPTQRHRSHRLPRDDVHERAPLGPPVKDGTPVQSSCPAPPRRRGLESPPSQQRYRQSPLDCPMRPHFAARRTRCRPRGGWHRWGRPGAPGVPGAASAQTDHRLRHLRDQPRSPQRHQHL